MCKSLATIQESIIERIGLPDLRTYDPAEMNDIIETWYRDAKILRGEPVTGTWGDVEMHVLPGQTGLPPGPQQGMLFGEHAVRIRSKVYPVCQVSMQISTLRIDETRPAVVHGDHLDAWVIPDGDDTAIIRKVVPGFDPTSITSPPS
jgi:hypothetical protein